MMCWQKHWTGQEETQAPASVSATKEAVGPWGSAMSSWGPQSLCIE